MSLRSEAVSAATSGADILSDPATFARAVPHAEFARLRAAAPVAWVNEKSLQRKGAQGTVTVSGRGYWAVTRYQAAVAAARNPAVFSSSVAGAFLTDPRSQRDLRRMRELLINMDAPQHARMRRLVAPAFTPRALRELEQSAARHAASLVSRLIEREACDFVADCAAELPLLVLAELFGMPLEDRALLYRWSNQLVGFDDPELGGGDVRLFQQTFVEAFAYVTELARDKRAHPDGGLITRLVQSEIDGKQLTESELCHFWVLLLVAGNETTRHVLSGGLQALLEWPEQARRLQHEPALLDSAVEELLRWTTPLMHFRRTATEDTELAGQLIRSGDKVVLYYISANRDDAVFAEPDRLDLGRTPNPHLAFGSGSHYCLGAALARLEAKALLRELSGHLQRIEPADRPERLTSNFMNGIKRMPIRIRPSEVVS
jgi:cytochrome P450